LYDGRPAITFSLNLGTDLLARLQPGDRQTRNEVRERIVRSLKAEFGPGVPSVVVLELDRDGRLHTHGVVGVQTEDLHRVDKALRAAGGKWSAAGPEYQLRLKVMYDPIGWWDYITKEFAKIDEHQRALWVGWSQTMKKITKNFYRGIRAWWLANEDDLSIRHSVNFFMQADDLDICFG
jgi:hypothetical protein